MEEIVEKIAKEVMRMITEEISKRNPADYVFHFKQIPLEAKKRQYVYFSAVVSGSGYGEPFMCLHGEILAEEAEETMSPTETIKVMMQKFKLESWQIRTQTGCNGVSVMAIIPNLTDNAELLKQGMGACGWSFSNSWAVDAEDGQKWTILSFDPMFQDNVSYAARAEGILFHWTPEYRYQAIKREGLYPRSENSLYNYPNRLHLLKGSLTENQCLNIGKQLWKANNNPNNNGRYVLLGIYVDSLSQEMEFYFDPRFDGGYYVKDHIPASAIKYEKGYDFVKGDYFKLIEKW